MCNTLQKYRFIKILLIIQLILICSSNAYGQNKERPDTVLNLPESVMPVSVRNDTRDLIFFDSLKVRVTKNPLTKKLYDFVIVTPDTIESKRITGTSDAAYLSFSGNKIRKIEIRRLDVFGVNINNPAGAESSRFENVLNKTHFNTNEIIIRKKLLFTEGDTISPLTLSDNERILRQLSYIDDARIIVVPVSDEESDIIVLTKDVYSLGGDFVYKGLKAGNVSLFEKNILGLGHEFGIEVPYNSKLAGSPGFGFHYLIDNIGTSFLNLNLYYLDGLGQKTYGFNLSRNLISSTTKYAGGISVKQMYTTEDLDTLIVPEPLKYNLQDYWLSRAFMINRESVSRIIVGVRYTNNNVFDRPLILPDSYYSLQKFRLYLVSLALSVQKYYKTSLIYGYGRTEDVPYGGLMKFTGGREFNEFKQRTYFATELSYGNSVKALGYFYASAGFSSYIRESQTEQGQLSLKLNYFSNLVSLGEIQIRNFLNLDYTRGFDRYTDEHLAFRNDNGFSGFRNDSITGNQRLQVSLESVLFSPVNLSGFRFAFFWFTDFSFLSGTNEIIADGNTLSSIGFGVRIRNDNLVFKTIQIRLGFFPSFPDYSKISNMHVSGEQLLRPDNFDSGPPSIIPYR